MTTNNDSLAQAVEQSLLPSKLLEWLETLPIQDELEGEEGIDLLSTYLQSQFQGEITLEYTRLLVAEQEVSYPRWLRWFLLDYDESPKPIPGWKPRYLLVKAIADDLRMKHEDATSQA